MCSHSPQLYRGGGRYEALRARPQVLDTAHLMVAKTVRTITVKTRTQPIPDRVIDEVIAFCEAYSPETRVLDLVSARELRGLMEELSTRRALDPLLDEPNENPRCCENVMQLKTGDIIRSRLTGEGYVVTGQYGDRATAVRTVDVTNPDEWLVMRS